MSAPIEAVLFDYGHTLIYFDERPHSALVDAYEKVNRMLADSLEREVPAAHVLIEKVSRAVDDEIQRDYATGRLEEVEIAAIYDAALRDLGLELEPKLIERVMELEQQGWLKSVHVGPDVVDTLKDLRGRGLRLALVSNAAYLPRLMKEQLAALGLASYFDGVTFSSEVGVRKPHPAIYQDALDKVRVEPSRGLFVGDRVREDVQGPKELGMRAVLTREWRQEDDPGAADFVIQRLGELPAVVSRLMPGARAADTYNEVTSRE
ncbi:MAG TPA: HAD family hydrolase [Candidatus Dormibacteraeota bacterium]|nr:HAD family hydrolase [Candidatus Dormibacteraeota bacterium]